ncbi:hypothetical protein AB0E06_37310 [Streptomyces sp. NPDC048109]|uniref:hypothetical protein n=1 Tax=Streptomyces TaxID=1883 RepID=UPI0034146A1C
MVLAAVMAVASGAFARTVAREGFAWDTVLVLAMFAWISPVVTVLTGASPSTAQDSG